MNNSNFRNTLLGTLPHEWKVEELGNIVTRKITDGTHKTPNYVKDGIPFITAKDINKGWIDFSDCKYITQEEHKKLCQRVKPEKGDILLSKVGTIGLVTQVRSNTEFSIFVQLALIKPRLNVINPSFLEFAILSNKVQEEIVRNSSQSTMKYIGVGKISRLLIPLPPLPEQNAIAHVLTTVRQSIEATERIITAAKEMKRSMMKHLFTYGPVPVDQADQVPLKKTEVGEVPEGWKIIHLKEILREPLKNGHSAKPTNQPDGVRTLILTAVTRNDFSIKNTKLTSANPEKVMDLWLKPGDILIERANTIEYIGLAALYEGPEDFAIFPDLTIRVRVKEAEVITKFLVEFLLTDVSRQYFRKSMALTSGSMHKINHKVVEQTPVPLPPYHIQQLIVKELRAVDEKIHTEIKQKNTLNALFNSLLHQLMTGKVRVGKIADNQSLFQKNLG